MFEELNVLHQNECNGKYFVKACDSTKDWLAARAKGIGASEVAAILGKSPWMTARELWEEKVHPENVKFKGNADTERGHRSEAHIRELYEIEMGVRVYDGTNIILRSVEHPFMSCTLDGFILEKDGPCVMEIKSVRGVHGDWSEDCIPVYYLIQVLAQLIVTGWRKAILVARFCRNAGWDKAFERTYRIHASDYEDEMDRLAQKVKAFWEDNVMAKKAPGVRVPSI